MLRKTDIAVNHFRSGRLKEALSLFCRFKIGFSKEEQRTLQIAHESLSGHGLFYQNIGIDTDAEIERSKEIIATKYQKI